MRKLAILIFLLSVPASAKQHRVSLTWTASTGCPATCTIAGYYVYKAKGSAPFAKNFQMDVVQMLNVLFRDDSAYANCQTRSAE